MTFLRAAFALALCSLPFAAARADSLDDAAEAARKAAGLGTEWVPHTVSHVGDHYFVSFRRATGGQVILGYYPDTGRVDLQSKSE